MVHIASTGTCQIDFTTSKVVSLPQQLDMQTASGCIPELQNIADGSPQLMPDCMAYAFIFMPADCGFPGEISGFAASPTIGVAYPIEADANLSWGEWFQEGYGAQFSQQEEEQSLGWCSGSIGPKVASAKQISAGLKAGGEACAASLACLSEPGVVRQLSFKAVGCRVVQDALELADRRVAMALAKDMRGFVVEAVHSPCANYVLQKMINVLTISEVPFVVEELAAQGMELVCHEYGCRIFCRLVEHAAHDGRTAELLDHILLETDWLVRHKFGHHVVERVLEHGLPHQRRSVSQALREGSLVRNAWDRTAVHVIEKALLYGEKEDCEALAWDLLAQPAGHVAAMAASHSAGMLARAMLQQSPEVVQRLAELLTIPSQQQQLRATRQGRRLGDQLLDLSMAAA